MKTKRIVALALASALALGAVATPVLADDAKSTVLTEKTAEAYNKVVNAQKKTVEDLTDKKAELEKKVVETDDADTAARKAVYNKEVEVKSKEAEIDAKQKEIDAKVDEKKENLNAMSALQTQLQAIPRYQNAKFEKKASVYDDQMETIRKATYKAVDLEALAKALGGEPTQEDIDDEVDELLKKDANYQAIKKAKELFVGTEANNFEDGYGALFVKAGRLQDEENGLMEEKGKLQNDLAKLNEELKDLQDAAKKANEEYGQVKLALEQTKQQLSKQEITLDSMRKAGKYLTEKMITNVTNPKINELGEKDPVVFVVYYLESQAGVHILPETLAKLNLDKSILNQYQDILGDEGDMKSSESQSTDDTQAPQSTEAPKPQSTEEAPKPDKKPEVKPEEKKDDKKVAPKTGDIAVLAYAGSAVLAAGAFVASKKRK